MNRIYKKILVIAFVFFASSTIVDAQPQVIINEFSQGSSIGTKDEWVELVVTQDGTNLQGVYLDVDHSAGTVGDTVQVQLANVSVFSSVPKGAIILIYNGDDTKDPNIAAADDINFGPANTAPYNTTGSDDWVLIIPSTNTTYLTTGATAIRTWKTSVAAGDAIGVFEKPVTQTAVGGGYPDYNASPVGIMGIRWGTYNSGLDAIWASEFGSYGTTLVGDIPQGNAIYFNSGDASTVGTSSNWIAETDASSSPSTLNGGNNNALPVELSSFSAIINKSSVNLIWKTQTEVNNYGFLVERSGKNEEWHSLGFVDGNGNSNSPKNYSFEDNTVNASGTYSYRLKQIDNDGTYEYSKAIEVSLGTPVSTELKQNYPNPFNPSTTINFTLTADNQVSLIVYNAIGEQVKVLYSGMLEAGVHSFNFNGDELPSGLYIYKLSTSSGTQVRKMMLVK